MIAGLLALAALFLFLFWQVRTGGGLVTFDGWLNAALRPLRRRPLIAAFAWLAQFGTGGAGSAIALAASALFWSDGRAHLTLPILMAFVISQDTK